MVILFGGSFDPPHSGHLNMARAATAVLKENGGGQLWWLPAAHSPFKSGHSASAKHRLAMLQLLTQSEANMRVCMAEIELAKHNTRAPSYTVHTLEHLTAKHPGETFSWLMGADQLPHLHTWKNIQRLAQLLHTIYVYPRPEETLELTQNIQNLQQHTGLTLNILKGNEDAASSTALRSALQGASETEPAGATLPSLPPAVQQYIHTHSLYA